jgi:hypothetical protein
MKNTTYIRNNFKTSTLPRLKHMKGYTSDKKIDACEILTSVLKDMENTSHSQDDLFNRLVESKSNDLDFIKSACIEHSMYQLNNMNEQMLKELSDLLDIK